MSATGVYYDESRNSWVVEYDYGTDRQEHYRSKAGAVKRASEMGWAGSMTDLTTLRAEVERMRRASVWREEGWGPDEERLKAASHAVDAYDRVLDLIDKHTREGQ